MATTGNVLYLTPGMFERSDHTLTGLPAPLVSATLGIKQFKDSITLIYTKTVTISGYVAGEGQVVSAGVVQADQTFTAEVLFEHTAADTGLLVPPEYRRYYFVTAITATGEPYASEVDCFVICRGGGPNG